MLQWIYFIPNCRVKSLTCVTISSSLEASCSVHWNVLDYGYTGARTDTTQQSGQTPDKEVKIKNVTVCVSGYTETDTTGMLFPPIVWPFSVAADINSNVFDLYFLIWSLSRLLCCVGSGSNVLSALTALFPLPIEPLLHWKSSKHSGLVAEWKLSGR